MGLTNLVAVPLGAMPMCHGSGGVAGKYAFGARTAGANVVLGLCYLVAATLGVGLVAAFPLPVLGVTLAVVAVGLGRSGLDSQNRPLTVAVGLCGLLTNVGVAFVAGAIGGYLVRRWTSP
jgi:MFS superfamily sulfate permease-like transporter